MRNAKLPGRSASFSLSTAVVLASPLRENSSKLRDNMSTAL